MNMWEQLQALMAELLSLYQRVLALSRQKKDLLILAKPIDLEKVVKQEEVLLLRVSKIDVARKQVIQSLVSHYAVADEQLTLEKLIALAPNEAALHLKKIAQEFDAVLAELKSQNQLNTKLIRQALNLVNYNINLLAQSSVGPTYAPPGLGGPAQGQQDMGQINRRIFDHKV